MENAMPCNYAVLERAPGWRFLVQRRLPAVGRRRAVLPEFGAVGALIVGLSLILAAFHPAGQIGSSRVPADRAGGGPDEAPEVHR
jgi:hypothetical protein